MRPLTIARDLARRKARERESKFVVEGIRAVEELTRSPLEIVGALMAPQLAASPRGAELQQSLVARGVDVALVSDREFQSAAETESPQGILAIAAIPRRSLESLPENCTLRLLVLDAVQDPGNVGTMLRTAAALGADATVALPGTVDLWNAKVVRSAMGAHFHHCALHAAPGELAAFLSARDVVLWGADAHGTPVADVRAPDRLALAVGNEGGGLTDPLRGLASTLVSLPIAPAVESLNVAVATGILLYQLRP